MTTAHQMPPLVTSSARMGVFEVQTWEQAGGPIMQDAFAVTLLPGRLRVAAIDGVTPTANSPAFGGVDSARTAALHLASRLNESVETVDVLRDANRHLSGLAPGVAPRSRPNATVAVAEVRSTEGRLSVEVWFAGDCDVWGCRQGIWEHLGGGSPTGPEAMRLWAQRRDELRASGAPPEAFGLMEEEIFSDRSLYPQHAPIGRFDELLVVHLAAQEGFEEVVVTTDGAGLGPANLNDIAGWLSTMREGERAARPGRIKPHDDLAVIRVRPASN